MFCKLIPILQLRASRMGNRFPKMVMSSSSSKEVSTKAFFTSPIRICPLTFFTNSSLSRFSKFFGKFFLNQQYSPKMSAGVADFIMSWKTVSADLLSLSLLSFLFSISVRRLLASCMLAAKPFPFPRAISEIF